MEAVDDDAKMILNRLSKHLVFELAKEDLKYLEEIEFVVLAIPSV